jgi:hypothetical protein
MKILAIEKELSGITEAQVQPYLKPEAARVYELNQAGVIRELYFDQDKHIAVLMLECQDAVDARKVLDTLPLVKARIIDFDIFPLIPYSGFSRLFAEQ